MSPIERARVGDAGDVGDRPWNAFSELCEALAGTAGGVIGSAVGQQPNDVQGAWAVWEQLAGSTNAA